MAVLSRKKPDALVAPRIWVVIPSFNEAERLRVTLGSLSEFNHILVVDDGSTDNTSQVVAEANVQSLRSELNEGQGAALARGFKEALRQGADIVVSFDADGQHDPKDIAALVAPIISGRADVVLGSRFLGRALSEPTGHRLLLKMGVWLTRVLTGLKVTDTHNGLRALNRDALSRLTVDSPRRGHASQIMFEISYLNLRYEEVPVTIRYLGTGRPVAGVKEFWEVFIETLRLWQQYRTGKRNLRR